MNKIKVNGELIVSISAMITAAIAVIIGIVELRANQQFQRLSVEPHLEIFNSGGKDYEFLVRNTGLGPAKIKRVYVSVEGDAVNNWNQIVNTFTEQETLKNNQVLNFTYTYLGEDRQVPAGEVLPLFHSSDKIVVNQFRKNLRRMEMKICYCSIFNDCWLVSKNNDLPKTVVQCDLEAPRSFPRSS